MLRWLIRTLSVVICLPVLYFGAGVIGAVIPGPHTQIDGGHLKRIALFRGPIHYDLVLPLTDDTRQRFAFANAVVPVLNPLAQNLVVGWGARSFYTTTGTYADLNLPSLWRAVVGDDAVMHLDVAGDLAGIDGLVWLTLSATPADALEAAILASFADTEALAIPGFGPNDAFYPAKGHFNALHTCNAWVGEVLRQAGLGFGIWTPTPQSVTLSARWFTPAPP